MIEDVLGNQTVNSNDVNELRKRLDTARNELMVVDTDADKYIVIVAGKQLLLLRENLNHHARLIPSNITKVISPALRVAIS